MTPENPSHLRSRLSLSLLLLRAGVGLVFLMWTLDKLINPAHAAVVFEKYYKIDGLDVTASYVIGGLQLILVLAFATGAFRTLSYGLITVLHTVSTLSAYEQYIHPWQKPNLLFYAAFPMLSACVALWLLRRYDDWTVDGWRGRKRLDG